MCSVDYPPISKARPGADNGPYPGWMSLSGRMPHDPTPTMPETRLFPYDLVMFDLDGTLMETASELSDALNDTLADLGCAPVAETRVGDWIGNGTAELLIRGLAESTGQAPQSLRGSELARRALALFDLHYERRCGTRSRLYPQAVQVLQWLRARSVRLAVVTNKDGRFTRRLLDSHRLTSLLDLVVAGDTVARKKPAPDGIAHCLAQLQVAATRALFVGDSAVDVASARNAGVAVWAVPDGYNQGLPIASARPDRVIQGLADLLAS